MSHRRTNSQRGLVGSMSQPSTYSPILSAIPGTPAVPESPFIHPDSPALPTFSTKHHAAMRPLNNFSWPSAQPLPKQVQRRTTWLALIGLGALCIYVFYLSGSASSLATIPLRATPPQHGAPPVSVGADSATAEHATGSSAGGGLGGASRGKGAHRHSSWRKLANAKSRPQITLDSAEELAAVTAFVAALAENHIPATVDPERPIDPQVVLDFDTRGDGARDELRELVRDVWVRNPVVLYSKFYSPITREIKSILTAMRLAPAPTIVEVDQRPDANVLTPLLYRLTSSKELPILIVGGHPVGSIEEIRMLNAGGELRKLIEGAGAKVDGQKKKGGRKH